MKPLFVIFVGLIAIGVQGQDVGEYKNPPATPPISFPSRLANSLDKAGNKSTSPTMETVKEVPSGQSKAQADQPAPKPTPPAVFILSNGETLESSHYVVTADSIRLQQGSGVERTIPLSTLNRDATVAANQKRGINLQIPSNKNQITLSF